MKFEDLLFAIIKAQPCYGHITGILLYEQTSEGWLCTCTQEQDYCGHDKLTVELTDIFMFLWTPPKPAEPDYASMSVEMLESSYCLLKMELRKRGRL